MVFCRRCPRPSGCNGGGHDRSVGRSRFLLLIWVAPWAALAVCHAAVPDFPKPTASWGTLHTLPLFRCEEHYPRMGNGSRGLDYQSAAPGARRATRHVPVGAHTCAVPLADLSTLNGSLDWQADGTITAGPEAVREYRTATLSTADLMRGRYVQNTQYFPQARDGAGPTDALFPGTRNELVNEAAVARTLALQRNTYAGSVHRVTGLFDVLAVSRLTMGVCLDYLCRHTAAVDTVGGGESNWGHPTNWLGDQARNVVLLTVPTATGSRASVSITDAAVLSLGYRAMVDRGWLSHPPAAGGVSAWNLSGLLILFPPVSSAEAVPAMLTSRRYPFGEDPMDERDKGDPSMWLQSINYVLCQPPARSFLTDPARRCRGVPAAGDTPSRAATTHDKRSNLLPGVVPALPWDINGRRAPAPPALPRRVSFRWDVDPFGEVPLRNCGRIEHPSKALRPAWLAAATSREINPASAEEASLGRSLFNGSCVMTFGANASLFLAQARLYSHGTPPQDFGEVDGRARQLAQAYSLEAFGVDPPDAPATTAAILLAVLVILPEALGVVVLAVEPRRWGRRSAAVLVGVFLAGALSTAGIVYLAVEEAQGAAWRAATVRDQVSVEVPPAVEAARQSAVQDRRLTGLLIIRTETTFVIARTGYRPALVVGVAAATAATYAALSVAAAVAAAVAARQQRKGLFAVQRRGGGWRQRRRWRQRHQPPPEDAAAA